MFKYAFEKAAKLRTNTELKDHQIRVQKKLDKLDALLLYHGLGSGKTLSAINAVGDDPTDFVVPASLRTNLGKELDKHTTSNKITGMSYQKYLKTLPQGENLVLDEVHRIGNPQTQISRKVMREAPEYKKRILLSGDPIRNHPYELAPLVRTLNPESKIPLTKSDFEYAFIDQVKKSPGLWGTLTGVKPGHEEEIKNVRALKREIGGRVDYHKNETVDYPSFTEEDEEVIMSKTQKKLYDKTTSGIPRSIKYKIEAGMPLSKSEKIHLNNYMNAARQVSNSVRKFGVDEDTPKMEKALEDVKEIIKKPRGKAMAYSNFLEGGLQEYSKMLSRENIPHEIFDGSLSDKKRQEIVNNYNNDKTKVLLLSGAGSEGLDLKGPRMVQVLEPHWNESRIKQVKGRAIRYKSHSHLPENERHVAIKNYKSVLPRGLWGLTDPKTSSDQYLAQLGEKKTELINQFLKVLEEESETFKV